MKQGRFASVLNGCASPPCRAYTNTKELLYLNDQPGENKVPVQPDDTDEEKDVGDDPGDDFGNGAVVVVLLDPIRPHPIICK